MYTVKGYFNIIGRSPDGDSILFRPASPEGWPTDEVKDDGSGAQVRLTAIDACETHFSPPRISLPKGVEEPDQMKVLRPAPGNHSQPDWLAKTQAESLLRMLGVTKVEWKARGLYEYVASYSYGGEVIQKKDDLRISGYVCYDRCDSHRRPLGWCYPSDSDVGNVRESLNYRMVREGSAYPYLFWNIKPERREALREATRLAITEGETLKHTSFGNPTYHIPHIWTHDITTTGHKRMDYQTITEQASIFPFLFRRMIEALHKSNTSVYWESIKEGAGFEYDHNIPLEWLLDIKSTLLHLPTNSVCDFHELFDAKDGKLLAHPVDLLFGLTKAS